MVRLKHSGETQRRNVQQLGNGERDGNESEGGPVSGHESASEGARRPAASRRSGTQSAIERGRQRQRQGGRGAADQDESLERPANEGDGNDTDAERNADDELDGDEEDHNQL